jgi:transposase
LVLPHADTQAMAHHLEGVSQAIPAGRHAVLVLDRAGWHTTSKLSRFPNVSLLPLRAGSPELNPAEQVWQQLRDRSQANRCYDVYEHIVDVSCEAKNAFTRILRAVPSLCTRSYVSLSPSAASL